jgi:hypothetical protein
VAAALCAFAATASAAWATEGPFYKVNGSRLAAGSTTTLSMSGETVRLGGSLAPEISCLHIKSTGKSELSGSNGATGGSGTTTLKLEGCAELTGQQCTIEKGTITTNPLTITTAYATSSRTGKIYLLFKPAPETAFALVHYTETCESPSMPLEGAVAMEVTVGGTAVEVGKEPAEASKVKLRLPGTEGRNVWTESAGILQHQHAALVAVGIEYGTMIGSATATVGSELAWGLFTH